jgi:hypothetical protein
MRVTLRLLGSCLLFLLIADPAPAQAPAAAPGAEQGPPAARFDAATLPGAARGETLLHVERPGRFAIRAESATGTALQLVDMATGPGDLAGTAGAADGRLDLLLDAGTYKLRLFGAETGAAPVRLSATPYREVAAPVALASGGVASAVLGDLEQRSAWFTVTTARPVRVEAVGRNLRDLRLWREGRDLVAIGAAERRAEPTPGRPLTGIVLSGVLEPGNYRITAYGGPRLAWSDGDAAEPLHLRLDGSTALDAGAAAGRIGPFGSEVFVVTSQADRFRLTLPEPAEATLSTTTGTAGLTVAIARDSREPGVTLRAQPRGEAPRVVEIGGREGQAFQLRAFGAVPQPEGDWRLVEAQGFGGDELPPTFRLLRKPQSGPLVELGAVAPRVGPGAAWRARFNLRGPSSLLVEVTAPGRIALRAEGVALTAAIRGFDQTLRTPTRADGTAATAWDLEAGWYWVELAPRENASGILDVTLGPPGLRPPSPSPPLPADPVLVIGEHQAGPDEPIRLFGGANPRGRLALVSRRLPLDLAAGGLMLTQRAGEALRLPLAGPPSQEVTVAEIGGAVLPLRPSAIATPRGPATLVIPAPTAPRSLVIARPMPVPVATLPTPRPAAALPAVAAGQPQFFDLARDQSRSFALTLPDGGLWRIETLGRLQTAGSVATAFVAPLDQASANGIGRNMLIARHLRAGAYRVTVTAEASSGRVGLIARPAPVQPAPPLRPGAAVRSALPAGSGLTIPIEIAAGGPYRLDLLSLGREVQGRLEDAEGWPLLPPGTMDQLVQDLPAGRYRLVVLPADVESRVVARLTAAGDPPPTAGHGPHPLRFGVTAQHEWREPASRDAPRDPDLWAFSLTGASEVRVAVSEGMGGEIRRVEDGERAGGFADGAPFAGTLPAGRYRIAARALGRDDRLPYRLTLSSPDLQPEAPRAVTLPTSLGFAIAEDRVVSLTSFGPTLLRATLRDGEGRVLLRDSGRAGDWNLAISRQLPAGRYVLDLAQPAPVSAPRPSSGADEEEGGTPAFDDPESEAPEAGASTIRLSLPEALPPRQAAASGETVLEGAGVHRLALPAAPDGSLMLAAAEAAEELVLSLERQAPDGRWQAAAIARGTNAVAAVPAAPGAWRASVWRVDGGAAPIRFALRQPAPAPQPLGQVAPLTAGIGGDLHVALVAVPDARLVSVTGGDDLTQASAPGQALAPVAGGLVAPQSAGLWLVARGPAPIAVAAAAAERPLTLSLAAGETATLPAGSGTARFWLAESGADIAALDAGRGMGLARGSTIALAGTPWLRLRNAEGGTPIRATLRAVDPALAPERRLEDALREVLPAASGLSLRLPEGPKRLRLDLARNTVAVLGWRGAGAVTIWAGDAAVSRLVDGDWTELLLVNAGTAPAPVQAETTRLDAATPTVGEGRPFRRFQGAAGSLALALDAAPGARLRIAGARSAHVIGRDGGVLRGADLRLAGPGLLVLEHGPGPLLAWIGDAAPFPDAAPELVPLPGHRALTGPAMALTLAPATPVLLRARTTAPVVLALGDAAPEVFAAGAEFQRYLPAGATRLRVMAPQDGPLSGAIELDAVPVLPAREGIGDAVMVGAGGSALFGFDLDRQAMIGLGIRAEPDRVAVRLLGADGAPIGEGVAQLRRLPPGRYVIEARLPADAGPAAIRPALVGLEPRPAGPPAEIARQYQAMTGVMPATAR